MNSTPHPSPAHLAQEIGLDAEGRISHPGLTFPGQPDYQAATSLNKPPNTISPPPWQYYTNAQAAELLDMVPNRAWTKLTRKKITNIKYNGITVWNKDETDNFLLTLADKSDQIPKGYISMSTAVRLSGVSRSTIDRAIEKYRIPTLRLTLRHSSGSHLNKVLNRAAFLSVLPDIQKHLRHNLLTSDKKNHKP